MFRSCALFVRLAKMRFGTERMRQALRKILVLALSVGLAVSAPALSHAQPGLSSVAASHESHDVQTMQTWLSSPETTAVRTARLGRRTIKMKVFARSAARLV